MDKLFSLQNGTDVRGVAYKDENSELDITLTKEDVEIIAKAFATWITDKDKKSDIRIALGMDSRVTGPEFRQVAGDALRSIGVYLVDCGLATTPSMFMTTVMEDYKCDGAIMFTASHMPYIYNGMKMFTEDGCLDKQDLKDVLDIAVSKNIMKGLEYGGYETRDLLEDYSRVLVDKIIKGVDSKINHDKPFAGMKIIVDAGNGAGGFFAEKVLARLGADTEGSQFLEPDGMFPNHIPNPENKEAMKSISQATVNVGADLGIIFDTDVDRAAIVGPDGKSINKNALIALIASILLEEEAGATIVTDSVTSKGLAEFIEKRGGVHHRFKRGYKNVINESVRLNKEGISSPLAIETSGHAALRENYFLDDGAYLIAKILMKAAQMHEKGQSVADIISDLKEAKESSEYRIKIKEEDFKAYADKVIEDLKEFAKSSDSWSEVEKNFEGVRVDSAYPDENGWFLLRASLHEPLLVLNLESDVDSGCNKMYSKIENFLKEYNLDL